MKGLRDRIEPRLHDEVEALGFEVVELEWAGKSRRPILRLRVDRPDSVPGKSISVDDCAVVSRALEQWLDEEFPERYVLEVSSPGIERPLVRPADWVRFAGQRVLLHGTRVLGDQGKRVEGELLPAATECARVALAEGEGAVRIRRDDGTEIEVALADVERARLVYEWT